MEDMNVKVLNENGQLEPHKILFTFECEELGKSYIAYENNKLNENDEAVICVASYEPDTDLSKLDPVTDPEELKMVEDVLNQIMEN